jgi:hypothetical protein
MTELLGVLTIQLLGFWIQQCWLWMTGLLGVLTIQQCWLWAKQVLEF